MFVPDMVGAVPVLPVWDWTVMVQVEAGLVATDTAVWVVPKASVVLLAGVVDVSVGVAALTPIPHVPVSASDVVLPEPAVQV